MRKLIITAAVAIGLIAMSGCVSSTTQIADPGVMQFGNGWFVASSDMSAPQSGPSMPVWGFSSSDFAHPTKLGYILNQIPPSSWINAGAEIWAPQIYSVGGKIVAYYSALDKNTGHRCIGMAVASSGVTNFTDTGRPFCSPNGYDLIDPSLFEAGGNSNYLLYKRDVPSAQGTRVIAMTSAGADGLHPVVSPVYQLLKPTKSWETTGTYASVEAPTLIRHGNYYYLFYSGSRYDSTRYGVGVARCPVSSGPVCDYDKDKLGAPILTSPGGSKYCGVGHQDVTNGGSLLWFHSFEGGATGINCNTAGQHRYIGADSLVWDSTGWPYVEQSGPGL